MPGQRGSLPRPIRHPTRAPVTKHAPRGCKQSRTPAQPWVAPASYHEGQRWGSTWPTPPIPRHGAPRGADLRAGAIGIYPHVFGATGNCSPVAILVSNVLYSVVWHPLAWGNPMTALTEEVWM